MTYKAKAPIPSGVGKTKKYLSIVAVSRNDDHGGDPIQRTQIFINSLAWQSQKYNLPIEIIIVDWNPVKNRPPLFKKLKLPKINQKLCSLRFITVPENIHLQIKYSDKLPLFQMIGKNVAIRRACGKFILASNIDIILSDELFSFIAKKNLDSKKVYRVDRHDIRSNLPKNLDYEGIQKYARENILRKQQRLGPEELLRIIYAEKNIISKSCPSFLIRNISGTIQIEPERAVPLEYLHTNACGDFTLMSKEGWEAIRGYPEFEGYSFNIDSMGFVSAHYGGFQEISLLPPNVCFHIEHSIGSGWTPEGSTLLFKRLQDKKVLCPDWHILMPLVNKMQKNLTSLKYNNTFWGLACHHLPENCLENKHRNSGKPLFNNFSVVSLNRNYDLDYLSLWNKTDKVEKNKLDDLCPVQLFWPNSHGKYAEINSATFGIRSGLEQKVLFSVPKYPNKFPLRLDPCNRPGLIDIKKVLVISEGRKINIFSKNRMDSLQIDGTAQHFILEKSWLSSRFNKKNVIESTGDDPMVILPLFSGVNEYPFFLEVHLIVTAAAQNIPVT